MRDHRRPPCPPIQDAAGRVAPGTPPARSRRPSARVLGSFGVAPEPLPSRAGPRPRPSGGRSRRPRPRRPTRSPAPAPAETEAPPAKTGPRPLLGVTPRPGPSADLPKPPKDPAQRREWLKTQLDERVRRARRSPRRRCRRSSSTPTAARPLYARDEKTPLNAASNVKIVTSAAGAVAARAPSTAGARRCRSSARPADRRCPPAARWPAISTCAAPAIRRCRPRIWRRWSATWRRSGLHKVRGALVVDDSLFDGGYVPPAYDQKNDSTASRAPSSAASLNGNVVAVTIVPGAGRRRARPRRRRSAVALLHGRGARRHRRPAARTRPPSTPRKSRRTRASTSPAGSGWAPTRARSTGASRSRRCSSATR